MAWEVRLLPLAALSGTSGVIRFRPFSSPLQNLHTPAKFVAEPKTDVKRRAAGTAEKTMTEIVSGQDLIDAGMAQGKWFRPALDAANLVLREGGSRTDAMDAARAFEPAPTIPLQDAGGVPVHVNIRAENEHEQRNIEAVRASMRALIRTPVVKAAAIMPDACPAGPIGTIPVGGVVASEAIHP